MSADIGPGDFVECVDASNERLTGCECPLVAGSVYQIAAVWGEIVDNRDGLRGAAVDLVGVPRPRPNIAYNITRFRPIYRPKPDAFTDLLKVPDRKRVTA